MSFPAPPSIWPHSPSALAEQVCQSVLTSFHDSASTLAETMQTLTGTPCAEETDEFFAVVEPLLTRNLGRLHKYLLRNVFSVPSSVSPARIAAAVRSHSGSDSNDVLDGEIAAVRSRIRQCENVIARLTAVQQAAEGESASLRAVMLEPVAPEEFHALCTDIKAAERDFEDVTNILRENRANDGTTNPVLQAASDVVSKNVLASPNVRENDENSSAVHPLEEHEPLNHFPTAQGIFGISMGTSDKLQELATLRARLLG